MRTIEIPELSLVALIGASGSGKSTFGRQHFLPTEICRRTSFAALSATTRTIKLQLRTRLTLSITCLKSDWRAAG